MMHIMDWNDLRYVLELGRHGTLSAGSDALDVVHTTVGRRVRALEDSMGVRLFDATPEGFLPTVAGQELIELAERFEAEVLVARGRLSGRDAALLGGLRVSMLDFVYDGFIEVFSSFRHRYPGIEVTFVVTEREVSLLRREADVVLRLCKEPPERLVGRRLGVMEFAPYASRALVDQLSEEEGEPAPLSSYPWIYGHERSDGRWLKSWLAQHARGAPVAMRTDSYSVLRASVAAGQGVHFLPCFDAEADPDLVCVGPRLDAEARTLWLLTLPEMRSNRRVRAFLDHVHVAFRDIDLSARHVDEA